MLFASEGTSSTSYFLRHVRLGKCTHRSQGMAWPAAGNAERLLASHDGDGEKDEYWVPADEEEDMLGENGGRPPAPLLFRKFKVKGTLLYLYRLLSFVRVIGVILFFLWRINNPYSDAMSLWWFTVIGDFWFGMSWLMNQIPKLNPIKCIPNLSHLSDQFDPPGDGGGGSISISASGLPCLDVFINTVDPTDEPVLYTMNSVLSILATDYPAEKHATYFSDDGGSLVHYEGLLEAAKFAALWVPFCRKHRIEPRAPERYFMMKTRMYAGKEHEEFLGDHRRVRREYDEFKVRLDALFSVIPRRSEAYNRASSRDGDVKATWMADGTRWPGTWIEQAEDHSKGHHAEIIQVMLNHPGNEPLFGRPASSENPLDFSAVDVRLPMLVYMAREKLPGYDHQKKAGAMNVQLRVSALLSNAPFIINFDGDHYINNSQAFRAAMCFFLDRRDGGNTAFVQFPQRFDDVDPTDRYCNHNRVFFDATLLGLNGIQGPSYVGTGCMFRRVALYGADPPRWRPGGAANVLDRRARKFGMSAPFMNSLLTATNQERSTTSVSLDEQVMAELFDVMACAYEDGTEWGNEVGWVYNIATEDLATGFRLHRAGWRSMYYAMEPDAFRGTAPINLTERLYQILRWSGGSLELFFSRRFCPLFAGRRLRLVQRVAYVNMTAYPVSALLILAYGLFPMIWLSHGMFYIQRPFTTYVMCVVGIISMTELIGMVEIRWAGLTVLDWFRNEQFYMIGATGVYPTAVLHILLRILGLGGVSFRLTAKQPATGARERFAELYDVQWAPLLAPTLVVVVVNVASVGVAVVTAAAEGWSADEVADAVIGLLFNVWILLLLYPFALGVMGRWSKLFLIRWTARLLSSRSKHRSLTPCRYGWDVSRLVPFLRRDDGFK